MKESRIRYKDKDIIVCESHNYFGILDFELKFVIKRNYNTHTLDEFKSFVENHLLNKHDDQKVIKYYNLETIKQRKLKIKNILEDE